MAQSIIKLMPPVRQQGTQIPNTLNSPDWCDVLALAAGVAKTYTLPADAAGNKAVFLRFSAQLAPIYIRRNATAVIPIADVADGTASQLLHAELAPVVVPVVAATDTISIISPIAQVVTIEVWE